MNARTGWACVAAALFAAVPWSSAAAQATTAPSDTVAEVRVEGNKNLSTASILAYAKTRPGQRYDDAMVRQDQQRMLQSGYFDSVSAIKTAGDKGPIVTFVVVERPKIAKITFAGNKSIKTGDLLKELPFSLNGPLNRFNVETGRAAILNKYRTSGYYYAEVTVDESSLAQHEVQYRIVEGPQVRIRKINFEGNTFFDKLKIRFSVESSARFWPFINGYLDNEQVQRDVNTLRNMYLDEGFLDADVDARTDFSADKRDVILTFRIRQGPRYRVNQVIVEGNTVFSDQQIRSRLHLKDGEFYTALWLKRDVKTLQDMYGELGFVNAKVEAAKQFVSPTASMPAWAQRGPGGKAALVNLTFTIAEQDQYTIGRIDIRGNSGTQSRVIRRELRFFPEQLFNTVAVEESRKRLMETRLFDEVNITPVGKSPNVRDVLVQVKEAKTAQFMVGVGVSTNSGLLGNISFTQRNFDISNWHTLKGAGQVLSIVAEPGTEMMRFHIDWTDPAWHDSVYTLGNRVYFFTRTRETYDETRIGDVVSLGRRFPNGWYAELAQKIEGVNIGNLDNDAPPEVVDDKGTSLLIGTKGSLVRDRTDSRWLPSTGDRLTLSYEEIYGSYNFGRVEGDYRIYRTLYKDAMERKHILAGRVAAGQIIGDAPVFEEFYGGGIGSIRGFKYRGVSPRDEDEVVGGETLFLAGTEYSYPLIAEVFRGVLFLDSGTVQRNSGTFESNSAYRVSVGFGFRLALPMMGPVPMSLDFGFPLVKDSQDDTQLVSFSVGWTF